MRILCSTTAGDGHFGPLVPIARACLAAGHEVCVAAPASFAGAVARAGLAHLPFADVPAERIGPVMARLPELSFAEANSTVMSEVFGRLDAQHALPGLHGILDQWRPDLIVREPAEFGSLAAAEAAGIPHVEVPAGVTAVMTWARPFLVEPLAELDALAGLPEGHLLAAAGTAPVLTSVPASMDAAASTEPSDPASRAVTRYRLLREPSHGRLPAEWGDPTHPLVYVSFGTVAAGLGVFAGVFPAALDALADLPVRVLLTTGHAGDLDLPRPWPSNAHVERFWPQGDVMPLAAAMVGHGGFGTTLTALAAGVPQVVVPLFTTDQELNAIAVANLGAGIRLDGGTAAIPTLGAVVPELLAHPHARESARQVANEIAALPAAAELVPVLEALASR